MIILHLMNDPGIGPTKIAIDLSHVEDDLLGGIYDLTNNPHREADRRLHGLANIRSFSAGDVVEDTAGIRAGMFVCCLFGWCEINDSQYAELATAGDYFKRMQLSSKYQAAKII